MPAHIRSSSGSGGWGSITSLFIRTSSGSGGWRNITQGWIRVSNGAGGWRQFFSSALTPSIASTVEISTNSSSFPATLTGTNYRWTDATSLTYIFQKSSDNVSFSDIGFPQTIANPAVGSSNTVTLALTRADFPAYTSYFRFVVIGTNTTFSTSFTSESTSVTVNKGAPFNTVAPVVTPSTGVAGTTTYSVTNGTWDPDDSDGTYAYQWQASDTPTFVSAPGTSTNATYTPPANFLTTNFSPIRCRVTATNAAGSVAAFSNTAAVTAPAGGGTPSAPLNLRRNGNGNGLTKSFQWDPPATGATVTDYQYSIGIGGFVSNGTSTSVTATYPSGGSQSITVRAVNGSGTGPSTVLSFTIPIIVSGPSSSVSGTSVTVSWGSTFQSSYSLSIPGVTGTPFTGTTATSRTITGLSSGTYTPTLTITSSTGDTHTVAGNSFTIGGGAPPTDIIVDLTSSSGAFITGDVLTASVTASGSTPFTYSYVWRRSTTSSVSSSFTTVSTTNGSSSSTNQISTNSTYENRWVRCEVTVTNSAGSASASSGTFQITSTGGPV